MMTLRPVRCFRASAMKRAITSEPPPAGKPTRIFRVLSGSAVSARAREGAAKAPPPRASVARRVIALVIFVPPVLGHKTPGEFGAFARRLAHFYRFGIGRIALQAAAIDALGDG